MLDEAYRFVLEIRGGLWDHVAGPNIKLVDAYPALIEELKRRYPGFSDGEYADAIAKSFNDSR